MEKRDFVEMFEGSKGKGGDINRLCYADFCMEAALGRRSELLRGLCYGSDEKVNLNRISDCLWRE